MNKSLMIDMDDPRAGKIAEVISNKTAKQILSLLAERELGVGDIAKELKIPINTAMYNVEKLVSAGLIEKSSWLWSVKGKKMDKYKISNKKIIISPKKLAGVIPALIFGGIATYIVSMINRNEFLSNNMESSKMIASPNSVNALNQGATTGAGLMADQVVSAPIRSFGSSGIMTIPAWEWFALGALLVILFYLVYDLINERRNG